MHLTYSHARNIGRNAVVSVFGAVFAAAQHQFLETTEQSNLLAFCDFEARPTQDDMYWPNMLKKRLVKYSPVFTEFANSVDRGVPLGQALDMGFFSDKTIRSGVISGSVTAELLDATRTTVPGEAAAYCEHVNRFVREAAMLNPVCPELASLSAALRT